jgi:hypothetical protein
MRPRDRMTTCRSANHRFAHCLTVVNMAPLRNSDGMPPEMATASPQDASPRTDDDVIDVRR